MKAMQKQKERSELGKIRLKIVGSRGVDRKRYTAPWDDNVLLGTIWVLKNHSYVDSKTYRDIGDLIGWGWRSVKNQFKILRDSILSRNIIEESRYINRRKRQFFRLKKEYCDYTFEQLVGLVVDTHYKSKYGPNNPETIILELLEEISLRNWKYTGDNLACNRIGKCYPDFTHIKEKKVIEHFGIFYHGEDRTGEPNDKHEKNKINYYKGLGFKCLIIWEHEIKDRNKLKKKIERFL